MVHKQCLVTNNYFTAQNSKFVSLLQEHVIKTVVTAACIYLLALLPPDTQLRRSVSHSGLNKSSLDLSDLSNLSDLSVHSLQSLYVYTTTPLSIPTCLSVCVCLSSESVRTRLPTNCCALCTGAGTACARASKFVVVGNVVSCCILGVMSCKLALAQLMRQRVKTARTMLRHQNNMKVTKST